MENLFGIEMDYDEKADYERVRVNELTIGDTFEGKPTVTLRDKQSMNGNNYKTIVVDLINSATMEYYTVYINCPEPDEEGYVNYIRKGYGFTRDLFDLIFSFQYLMDPTSVVTEKGEEKNTIRRIKIKPFLDFLNSKEWLQFQVTEGDLESKYNGQKLIKIE